MKISNISVSRAQLFEQCNYNYKLKYELQLIPPDPEPIYFIYGKMVHLIAQNFIEDKGSKPLNEVANEILNGEVPIETDADGKEIYAPKLPADYKKRLPKHLKSIQNLANEIGFEGDTEYKFEFDLDPPHKRILKGVIDRLIIKNDKAWIIDYKTSKMGPWIKSNVINNLQLQCYAMVVHKQFKIPAQNISAGLYYLETGKPMGAIYSEGILNQTEKYMLEMYKEIETMPAENAMGNVGDHCKRCSYVKNCPYYKIS